MENNTVPRRKNLFNNREYVNTASTGRRRIIYFYLWTTDDGIDHKAYVKTKYSKPAVITYTTLRVIGRLKCVLRIGRKLRVLFPRRFDNCLYTHAARNVYRWLFAIERDFYFENRSFVFHTLTPPRSLITVRLSWFIYSDFRFGARIHSKSRINRLRENILTRSCVWKNY